MLDDSQGQVLSGGAASRAPACREAKMLEGVMLLWFIQVVLGVLFVAIDIRTTPEATVMKWGFVIIIAFSGLFGALLYVLSCREPLPGTHELYVAAKWRQVVGSTMHCVAGDGIGILAAAVITSGIGLPMWADVLCEYGLGFLFGWTVFQALFMKSMFSSYRESLSKTFMSEGGMRPDARFFVSCGASGQVVATSVDYGRGWVNKPGSVSARIPRPVSRLSLRRTLLMLLGATATSIASHTCRARSGWSAAVNTAMICW
ncbi:DUF4396 domain-containing protein [Streptomyces sp. NPDC058534]|uniref:DUF4396 domain-containing protein n=1 Tax=Streptomyces sp. NPDC058534 TaxID=3346541 RepID=UPI003654D20F